MILDEIIKNKEIVQRKMSAENDYDLLKIVKETHNYVEKLSKKLGIKIKYAHDTRQPAQQLTTDKRSGTHPTLSRSGFRSSGSLFEK